MAETAPDLVGRNPNGQPESVRYEQINAMLLNEFLKEHRKVEEQGAIIARQQKQIEALSSGLDKVNAQLPQRVCRSVLPTNLRRASQKRERPINNQ